ncbi:MAG: hypothetical protein RLZZ507_685 [Cyanobacteriota bacterium]|jgi:tetratricopeptide (TPR) repeat protein
MININDNDAVEFTQNLIHNHTKKSLNNTQMTVLRACFEGKGYPDIAKENNFNYDHTKKTGYELWTILTEILGTRVTQKNFRTVIEQKLQTEKKKTSNSEISPKCNDELRDFFGRDTAIKDIDKLVNERNKIIVIQAAGGVGKTTLAKQYLYNNFDLVLPLEMAKDTENITAVESEIETWLKQYFQEEPGRDFKTTLNRLKQQLQNRKVGILIDNLEPALDERGRLIEKNSLYVELLRVLAGENVQSLTLITSRERLCDDRVNGIYHYHLAVLTVEAWGEFFTTRKIKIDTPSLEAMQKIYGGNAKAMDILFGVMREDYDGDMAAYWLENSTCVETELKNLVESQFKRLQTLDIETYKLLCRLGCFRYQDVPRVSTDALLALLWDVPQEKQRDVIKALRNRCLVEFEKGEYWLHPVIRKQGIERLKASGEWEEVNCKAAEFWTNSVKTIETIDDAKKAFEAYHHNVEINDYDQAVSIILKERDNKWVKSSTFSVSCYRLGLLQQIILAINFLKDQIVIGYELARLYNILALIYWVNGCIYDASRCSEKSIDIIRKHQKLSENRKCCTHNNENHEIQVNSLFLEGVLRISMGELKSAMELFTKIVSYEDSLENYYNLIIKPWFCLAYLNSCLGFKKEAYFFAKKSEFSISLSEWELGHKLFFLGKTYKNLGKIEKSFSIYKQAIEFAEESHYTQLKAKTLTGLAELYRIQNDFKIALFYHSESIEILDKIGAKCDLAEAYYQLGLTYQKIGETEKIHTNFNEAIRLFNEIEAPKQVEKVEKAKTGNID